MRVTPCIVWPLFLPRGIIVYTEYVYSFGCSFLFEETFEIKHLFWHVFFVYCELPLLQHCHTCIREHLFIYYTVELQP